MANITWRDQTAPDISKVIDGYADLGNKIPKLIGGISTGAKDFVTSRDADTNKQLEIALAKMPSAQAAEQAVASGFIGGLDLNNPGILARLTDENVKALSAGGNNTRYNAEATQRELVRAQQQKLLTDAAATRQATSTAAKDSQAEQIANITRLNLAGKFDEAKLATQQLNTSGMTAADATALLTQADKGTDDERADANGLIDRSRKDTEYNRGEATRADGLAAEAYANNLLLGAGGNQADAAALALADPDFAKLSSPVQSLVRAMLGGATSGGGTGGAAGAISAAVGGVAATGGGPAGPADERIVADVVQPPKPITEMTLSELDAFGKNVVIPATKRMDPAKQRALGLSPTLGSSAMGRYQIIGDTALLYAKKLRLDPNTTKFTAAVQDQLAEAIYNDARKGDLTKVFAGVPQAASGAYANTSWADMRAYIAKKESGGRPDVTDAIKYATANADTTEQVSQSRFGRVWAEASQDDSSIQAIAKKAKIEEFTDAKVSEGEVLGILRKIQNEGKKQGYELTPAVALAVLKESTQARNTFLDFPFRSQLGNGIRPNWRLIDDTIKQMRLGTIKKEFVSADVSAQVAGDTARAVQQVKAAEAEVIRLTAAAAANPSQNPRLLASAQAKLTAALQAQRSYVQTQRDGTPLVNQTQPTRQVATNTPAARLINWGVNRN